MNKIRTWSKKLKLYLRALLSSLLASFMLIMPSTSISGYAQNNVHAQRIALSKRIEELRTLIKSEEPSEDHQTKSLLAQWYNWGNWPNWPNWQNWPNWPNY